MRVVAVLDSLTPGGTETSTVLLGSRLIEMGIEFSIVALRDTDPDLTDLAANAGIPIHLMQSDSLKDQLFELRK